MKKINQPNKQLNQPNQNKEIRNIMNSILKTINSMKANPFYETRETVKEEIINSPIRPCDLIDEEHNSLAHICVKKGKLEVLRVIVEVYIAILKRSEEFFKWFLIENIEYFTVFELAAQNPQKEIIKYLYSTLGSDEHSRLSILDNRNNIFHCAAKENLTYPIIFFFDKLQKYYPETLLIDIPNKDGNTPLHFACLYGNKGVMDLLLDLGSNINEADKTGYTSLHFAVQSGSERSIKKLLVRGANKYLMSENGQLAYTIASELDNKDIALLLKKRNFCEKIFSKGNEIGPVKGSRNNLMLLLLIMIVILGKSIYVFKIAFMLFGSEWEKELMPFVPNIAEEILDPDEDIRPPIKISKLVHCFVDTECIFESSITFLSLIGDFMNLFVVIFFLCFAKKVYVPRKSKREVKSIIKLFEENKTVCIKCRIPMKTNTVHCLVCNACVNDWDHHCFWLNTCINDNNKTNFKVFVFGMLGYLIVNMLFFLINCFLGFFERYYPEFYSGLFEFNLLTTDGDDRTNVMFIAKFFWIGLNLFLFFTCFYSLIFIIIPISKEACNTIKTEEIVGQTLSEYQAKLLNHPKTNSESNEYFL